MNRAFNTRYDPPHAQYPGVWELGANGPQGVFDYLTWLLADEVRLQSAAEAMRYLRIGMHFLTVAQKFNSQGDVVDKLELNFWSEEFPPEVGAGGHAHARSPQLWSFIHPNARQTVQGLDLLSPAARRLPSLPIMEGLLTMLTKVDPGDGLGTIYHPYILGPRRALRHLMRIPPGTYQTFSSLYIHDVGFQGPGVGVSVQRQGPTEPLALNTFEGFVHYKRLTADDASAVLTARNTLAQQLTGISKLVASTVLFRDPDFTPDQLESTAQPVPLHRAESLLRGGVYTQEALGAVA